MQADMQKRMRSIIKRAGLYLARLASYVTRTSEAQMKLRWLA